MIAINLNTHPARRALSPAAATAAPATPARQRSHPRRARNSFIWALVGMALVSALALAYVSEAAAATQASYRISALKDEQRRLLAEQEATRYAISLASSAGRLDAAAIQGGLVQAGARQFVNGATNPIALARQDELVGPPRPRSLIDQFATALGRPTVAEAKDR